MESLYQTQAIYRELLQCMSRPGTVQILPGSIRHLWGTGMEAIAATLLDNEVSFSVLDDDRCAEKIEEISLGRRVQCDRADFLFIPAGDSQGQVCQAKRGEPEYPDMGATIIYQVEQLAASSSEKQITLTGPGIEEAMHPSIVGIPLQELAHLAEINSEYPLGVDVLLVDHDNRVMAIPRSTHVQLKEKRSNKGRTE